MMNQDSASCTRPNAPAVCVNPPNGISPEKNRGAATMKGKMTATCSYPAVSAFSSLVRRMIAHQLPITAAETMPQHAFSSASPEYSAMPSMFSRTRTRL